MIAEAIPQERSAAEVQLIDALCECFERCDGWCTPEVLRLFTQTKPQELINEGWIVVQRSGRWNVGFAPGEKLKKFYDSER